MARFRRVLVSVITGVAVVGFPSIAHAESNVTYVVDSADIGVANGIEYFDGTRRVLLQNVALPWRMTVMVADPRSLGFDGAEVRADWRPAARPSKWVSARIYFGDTLVCENALDLGNAACYGSTSYKSSNGIHVSG